MAPAVEEIRMRAAEPELRTPSAEPRLNIEVVFTSMEATPAALRQAGELANQLAARITLVVPQVVPLPLPLEEPPVRLEWSERRLRAIAAESPVETRVEIYLCRDSIPTLCAVLKPHSVVVLAGRKRWWWPTWEGKLSRVLRADGHAVIFAEAE